ncbi:hypothetical protein BU14_0103s0037 [Porphyra umbilicalis]|uniref:Major facilitator superfamily (MFS) profile domain-containing protein n=1 Tax=Porphyra umbilicalis TaxID=2786 RepID=A0A1X6PCU1_PORUM|nr:hypothetical protein BU14_0103s0037 [Porphyra umbilicalis]|eukprot:OSX78692.1 hypothetical protein BU14_0103s0037 [Porphyra umbilicalis]
MRLLVAIWLLYSCAYYGLIFWLPLLLEASSATAAAAGAAATDAAPSGLSPAAIGLACAVPYTAAAVAMLTVARSSDAAVERRLHLAVPSFASGLGFVVAAAAVASAAGVGWVVLGVSLAAAGCWSLFGPYWAVPTAALSGDTAAAAFAAINSVGVVGGYIGPALVGALVGKGGGGAEGGRGAAAELTVAGARAASRGFALSLGVFAGLMVVVGVLALALDRRVGGRSGGGKGGGASRAFCGMPPGGAGRATADHDWHHSTPPVECVDCGIAPIVIYSSAVERSGSARPALCSLFHVPSVLP